MNHTSIMQQFTGKKAKASSYQFSNTVFVATKRQGAWYNNCVSSDSLVLRLVCEKKSFQKNPSKLMQLVYLSPIFAF